MEICLQILNPPEIGFTQPIFFFILIVMGFQFI